MNAHNSEKLPVTFELRGSVERPAVVRYDGHCLEIYKHRIKYLDKCKYWRDIIKCDCDNVEKCETFASVPLTRTEEVETCETELKRLEKEIGSGFDRSDYIQFWITCPNPKKKKNNPTMGHFYVSSSGVAWFGKNCADPGIKSWDDLDEWM